MLKRKIVAQSKLLARAFHVDRFRVGATPVQGVLFFGGSGIDEEEYSLRARSIIPVFDEWLDRLERADHSFEFAYVTAPFDVPFARFWEFPEELERWKEHVTTEIIPAVQSESTIQHHGFHLGAYSGGAALALTGAHHHPECLGAGMLGADGIPKNAERPAHWDEPIALYYNREDRVRQYNEDTIHRLEDVAVVTCMPERPGTHRFDDYLRNGSFEDLFRRFLE